MEITAKYFVLLCLALIAGVTISWVSVFFLLRKQDSALKALLAERFILRIITVVFIIAGAGMLALVNKLSGEAAAILSGVAGFVLGGIGKGKKENVER
jgi:thiosulfate reductase cytochrome b subunit